jgi:hypothetical protein
MQFRLRTLLIVLALGPPVLAGTWRMRQMMIERQRQREFDELVRLITETVKPIPWDEVGGPNSVDQSTGNLSIVIGTGQKVQEQPEPHEWGPNVPFHDPRRAVADVVAVFFR